METIKELRARCQSVHKGDVSAEIVRSVSIYITWMLIPTRISGNGVSIMNCAVAVLAGLVLAYGTTLSMLLGIVLFALNTILDGVDGEVARYWKKSSLTGLFADRINTVFVYPFIYYGAGIGLARYWDAAWLTHIGAIGGWSLMGLRLVKTSIDATLVDAVTLPKARQEEGVKGTDAAGAYRPMSEYLRSTGRWYMMLVDFVLIRQPGMCLLWIAAGTAEVICRHYLRGGMSVLSSPLVLTLQAYAIVGAVSIIYGVGMVISRRKVESQFLSVFGPGGSAKL